MSLLDRIADRIHARTDATAEAHGLTVTRLPGGRRRIGHPDLPALLEARRNRALTHGLDATDHTLMDPATRAALNATRAAMTNTNTDRLRRAA
ncbi:hypothetical protein [Actinoplanes sp. NPDC049118]|uniref:hypothetical protein n=1 Tax=Actinoplanes sp. NPDC049118 TaxID=3155769 RepID=UPI003409484D